MVPLAASELQIHTFLLAIHNGSDTKIWTVQRELDGNAKDYALSSVSPGWTRSRPLKKGN